jgi:hypothetical protein
VQHHQVVIIIIKLCVQQTRQNAGGNGLAGSGTEAEQEAADIMGTAVALLHLVMQPLNNVMYPAVRDAVAGAAGNAAAGSSSSSSSTGGQVAAAASAAGPAGRATVGGSSSSRDQQIRASAVCLLVVMCRGVVALHEAAMCIPGLSAAGLGPDATGAAIVTDQDAGVQQYISGVLAGLANLFATLELRSMKPLGVGRKGNRDLNAAPAPAAAAAEQVDNQQASSSSSSSSQAVGWQYLLRLHESRKLAAACDAHWRKWTRSLINAVQAITSWTQKP